MVKKRLLGVEVVRALDERELRVDGAALRIERRAHHARDRHEVGIVEEHLHLIGERGERGLEHEVVVRLVDEVLQQAVELIARVGVGSRPWP